MNQLTVEKDAAIAAYNTASAKEKKLLENLLGREVFQLKITDRVKTIEDAYKLLKRKRLLITDFSAVPESFRESALRYCDIVTLYEALNEGWVPDWENDNQKKWYPWFKMQSGFGFSCTYYYYSGTFAIVGSRLCLKSQELAKYAGTQFEHLFKDFLTINQ